MKSDQLAFKSLQIKKPALTFNPNYNSRVLKLTSESSPKCSSCSSFILKIMDERIKITPVGFWRGHTLKDALKDGLPPRKLRFEKDC